MSEVERLRKYAAAQKERVDNLYNALCAARNEDRTGIRQMLIDEARQLDRKLERRADIAYGL